MPVRDTEAGERNEILRNKTAKWNQANKPPDRKTLLSKRQVSCSSLRAIGVHTLIS